MHVGLVTAIVATGLLLAAPLAWAAEVTVPPEERFGGLTLAFDDHFDVADDLLLPGYWDLISLWTQHVNVTDGDKTWSAIVLAVEHRDLSVLPSGDSGLITGGRTTLIFDIDCGQDHPGGVFINVFLHEDGIRITSFGNAVYGDALEYPVAASMYGDWVHVFLETIPQCQWAQGLSDLYVKTELTYAPIDCMGKGCFDDPPPGIVTGYQEVLTPVGPRLPGVYDFNGTRVDVPIDDGVAGDGEEEPTAGEPSAEPSPEPSSSPPPQSAPPTATEPEPAPGSAPDAEGETTQEAPGPSPVFLVAGLAAVALAIRRRN